MSVCARASLPRSAKPHDNTDIFWCAPRTVHYGSSRVCCSTMRQLLCVLAVLLTSPLLCACSECDTQPSDDLLERIISTLNASWDVEVSNSQVLCDGKDNETMTLAVAFKPCKNESCDSRVVVTDVTCTSEGMWEQASVVEVLSDSYESLASGSTDCSTCVDEDTFATYPESTFLDYNQTTHCLCKCRGPVWLRELMCTRY